jgi:hypothetical protein
VPNETTTHVHRIVTPGPGLLYATDVAVLDVRWVSPSAAKGDQVVIEGADGRILWETVADGDVYKERDYIGQIGVGGYRVPALDSGTLYIHIGDPDWEWYYPLG